MTFSTADFLADVKDVRLSFCRYKWITGECVAANITNFKFQTWRHYCFVYGVRLLNLRTCTSVSQPIIM